MSSDPITVRGARLNSSVEVGRYTALSPSTGTYSPDGVDVPTGANTPFAGVSQESVIPDGLSDYSAGVYQITSGTAWPANSRPSSGVGLQVPIATFGRTKAIAAGALAVGDRANIADSQGRFKKVDETAGTLIHDCGRVESVAGQAGDVFWLFVNPVDRIA